MVSTVLEFTFSILIVEAFLKPAGVWLARKTAKVMLQWGFDLLDDLIVGEEDGLAQWVSNRSLFLREKLWPLIPVPLPPMVESWLADSLMRQFSLDKHLQKGGSYLG